MYGYCSNYDDLSLQKLGDFLNLASSSINTDTTHQSLSFDCLQSGKKKKLIFLCGPFQFGIKAICIFWLKHQWRQEEAVVSLKRWHMLLQYHLLPHLWRDGLKRFLSNFHHNARHQRDVLISFNMYWGMMTQHLKFRYLINNHLHDIIDAR